MAAGDESILRTNAPATPFLPLPKPIPSGAKCTMMGSIASTKLRQGKKSIYGAKHASGYPTFLGMREQGEMLAKAGPPKKSEDDAR